MYNIESVAEYFFQAGANRRGFYIFAACQTIFWDGASKEEGPLAQSVRASDS